MGIDRTNSAAREDDPPASAASGDRSAERTGGQQASLNDHAHRRAETLTRDQYADAMRADGSPVSRDNSGDDRKDLDRAAAGQPNARAVDADPTSTPTANQHEASHQPETITFENKEVEVTRNASDGIWIEGLPGEPPARIGDLVRSAEDPAQGRGEKLRKELNKEAEDISDTSSKWADYFQEILDSPRPTHSMTHSGPHETPIAGSDHGISAGHGAEAVITLAIVGTAVVHKLHERWQRAWEHP